MIQNADAPNYKFSDFITEFPNALDEEFCNHCIEKFKTDDRKYPGIVGSGLNENLKVSMDLVISEKPDWEEEDNKFCASVSHYFKKYCDIHKFMGMPQYCQDWGDQGYQIQETKPGGFYSWHHDFAFSSDDGNGHPRYLTFIWYLNDIHEDGYTEFIDGTKIQPETGKMLVFPAIWTYTHRGYPPKSETKYICTGWIHGVE